MELVQLAVALIKTVFGGIGILLGINKSKQTDTKDEQNFKSFVPDDKKAPLIDRKKEIEEKVENINKVAAELKQQQENAAKIAQNAIAQSKALKKKKVSSSAKSTPIENPSQPPVEPLKSTTAQLAASATVDTPASTISSFNFPSNSATEKLQDALFNNLESELGKSWQSDFIRSVGSPYILKKDTEEIQISKDKIDIKSSNEETFLIILRTLHKTDNTVIPEITSPAKDVATWGSAFTKFKKEFPEVDMSNWTINGETPKAMKEVSLQDNAANDFADEKTPQSQHENQSEPNPYSENDADQQHSQKHGM